MVCTGLGARPSTRPIVFTTSSLLRTTWMSPDGVPASCFSNRASSPVSPTLSPVWYGSPNSSSFSAVASPTVPSTWVANSGVGPPRRNVSRKRVPGSG